MKRCARPWLLVLAPAALVLVSCSLARYSAPEASASPAGADMRPMIPAVTADELREACYRTREALAPRLLPGCNILVRPPFVIAGDLTRRELEDWYETTIAPATQAMQRTYFDVPPYAPVTLLLFSCKQTYEAHAWRLFGDRSVSIYGYFKPAYRTVLANVGAGAGTLVHELTHALVAFDFPEAPDWFNEGLASLHEHCRIRRDGAGIDGLSNWRLPVLREAILDGRVRTIEALMQADDFRERHEGLNYAQARYFCAYLQYRGLLTEYYRRFRDNHARDPRGLATLRLVVPELTGPAFERDFRAWVLAQSPP